MSWTARDFIPSGLRQRRPQRWKIPNATQNHFIDAALAAKTNSPMARLLNTNISMIAHLDA